MSKKIRVDMTGVESYSKASEGQHVSKISSVKETQTTGGNDALQIAFEVIKGEDKGSRVYETFPLVDTALWKLKGLLNAIGVKADGKVILDIDKLIGKVCIIEVFWDEYNGQQRAKIQEFRKLTAEAPSEDEDDDEDEDEDEEEETPKKKSSKAKPAAAPAKKAKKKPEPEPEEDEDEDEDEEDEPAPKAKKKSKPAPAAKSKKAPAKSKKKPADEDEDEDDDDEDDDWEEADD